MIDIIFIYDTVMVDVIHKHMYNPWNYVVVDLSYTILNRL